MERLNAGSLNSLLLFVCVFRAQQQQQQPVIIWIRAVLGSEREAFVLTLRTHKKKSEISHEDDDVSMVVAGQLLKPFISLNCFKFRIEVVLLAKIIIYCFQQFKCGIV